MLGLDEGEALGETDTLGLKDGLALGETEALGLKEGDALGEIEALGLRDGLVDGDTLGDTLAEGLTDGDTLGDREGDALSDIDGLLLGLPLGLTLGLSLALAINFLHYLLPLGFYLIFQASTTAERDCFSRLHCQRLVRSFGTNLVAHEPPLPPCIQHTYTHQYLASKRLFVRAYPFGYIPQTSLLPQESLTWASRPTPR